MRSTDPTFVDLVDDFLAPHRARDDVEAPSILSADAGTAKTLPGNMKVSAKMTLYFGTVPIYRGFSQLEMAGRLIRFVRNNGLRFRNDFIRLDAGSVAFDGGAVLMLSGRDHRVAAVSARLVERGASLLGDDVSMWEPVDRLLHPIAMPITMDADLAHANFPELVEPPRRGSRRDETMPHVWPVALQPEELGGANATEPAPIRQVLLVDFSDEGSASVEPLGLTEAVFAASRSVKNLEIWGERSLIALRELYEQVPFSRLVASSVDDAAEAVMRTIPDMERIS